MLSFKEQAKRVQDLILKVGGTIATAESLTGGLTGHAITQVPGASAYYRGGVCAYTLDTKVRVLRVDQDVCVQSNCVSEEVAYQMAEGARRMFHTSIAVATTGYATPDPAQDVQTPYAWVAISSAFGDDACRISCPNLTRVQVQEAIAYGALERLEFVLGRYLSTQE